MTLTTHILIATAVAKPLYGADPSIIFLAALSSHYLADAIPHWDYHLVATKQKEGGIGEFEILREKKLIFFDLARIGCDMLLGSVIVIAVLHPNLIREALLPIFFTIVGAILPDSLQPLYFLWGRWPITWIHRFHSFMHTKIRLGRDQWTEKKYVLTGKISQLALATLALWLMTL